MTTDEALTILQLSAAEATSDAVNHRFRELAWQLHPDRGGSEDRLATIVVARDVLLGRASDDDDGVVLNAFVGDEGPILRLAGYLMGAAVMNLKGLWMIPFTPHLRAAAQATLTGEYDLPNIGNWPFRSIDLVEAHGCASLAGIGRTAYLEVFGYKDSGYELGVGWENGIVKLGPVNESWYGPGGGSIKQVLAFLETRVSTEALLGKGGKYYAVQASITRSPGRRV
ncbi:MAG TPA: J domain-containing protein [Vicinamibacterales bacterium]|nr:J domain-containing protein [Vicinamibacterales bacterium]